MEDFNLEKILEEKDDSKVLDEFLKYYDKLEIESDAFMECLVSKEYNMHITWEQPWYQNKCRLTKPLKKEEVNGLESFRTGRFTKEESDIVHTNWKKFVRVYKVPDTPQYFTYYKIATRKKATPQSRVKHFVTAFLAQGLKRCIYQVHKHLLHKYSFTNRGKYTPAEERLIKICVNYYPKKACGMLSWILKREPRHIYNKMEEIQNNSKEEIKKARTLWTLKKSSRFLKLIMKYTGLSLNELKNNKSIDKLVWDKISKKIDKKSAKLREYWYRFLHPQIFIKEDLKNVTFTKIILKRLYASSYQLWSDINWKEFVKEFPDGCTSEFIYDIARRPFARHRIILQKPLREALEHAFRRMALDSLRYKRLRRLKLNDLGELQPVCIK